MDAASLEEHVETLAQKLLAEPGNGVDDLAAARIAARRSLEDSEERTFDRATVDPAAQNVIRRESSEPAASGESRAD